MGKQRGSLRASLTAKIDLLLVLSLAFGLGSVFTVFGYSLVKTRTQLTERSLIGQADLLYASIENFMLPGEAPIAVKFFREVEAQAPDSRITLYRRDGTKAFVDDQTIIRVNTLIRKERFARRGTISSLPMSPPRFAEALARPPREIAFRETEEGRSYFRIYRPLINLPKCTGCHGGDHTVRGVIDIRSEISGSVRTERLILASAGGGFFLVVSLLAVLIGLFLRRLVISPVQAIGRLCAEVTEGRFEGRVEVESRDEIGELAGTVNAMVKGLYERYELTKYVSAGTIGALSEGEGTRRVNRTLFFSDVRGFTAYTEKRDAEAVVEILNRLLELESRIIHETGGDIDKFVGDEVVAVFQGEDAPLRACRAALAIRDAIEAAQEDFDGLRLGFGIGTGSVIQGRIGSERRADFTVIGDSVNLASRLCSLAKGGEILVCPETRRSAGSLRFKGPFGATIKGKEGLQKVWLLEGAYP